MPSFFDLQKYAATGIAAPDMSAYDKARALAAFGGGKMQTLTGVPPLSFTGNGTPLISWSMLGNAQQTGTPSPDAPIVPEECGERTGNLFDVSTAVFGKYIDSSGVERDSSTGETNHSDYIPIIAGNQYTLSETKPNYANITSAISWYTSDKQFIIRDSTILPGTPGRKSTTWTAPANAAFAIINFVRYPIATTPENDMLNLGSTALPYEPYGYKIPITCAGQTVPVYLGQTQTVRRIKKLVLTGEEDAWGQTNVTNSGFYFNMTGYLRERGVIIVICSHYVSQGNINGAAEMQDGKISFYANATSPVNRFYIKDSNCENLADFKSFLAAQYAAGTPVTVWYVLATPTTGIINEPLCKIGDYADELHSEDTTVSIPTAKGQNTLTVETELQPSEMTITYRG